MADKKRFLLRLDPELHARLEKWAADDLRSLNAQIEFLLREALRRAHRLGGTETPESSR
ncbi:MAG: toxin-antitoxin system HicB family antitoxin [Acidobacteriota bacterium]